MKFRLFLLFKNVPMVVEKKPSDFNLLKLSTDQGTTTTQLKS